MKRAFKIITITMAAIMSWFSPMQVTHGTDSCCAECRMMKKEDEVSVVEEAVLQNKIK